MEVEEEMRERKKQNNAKTESRRNKQSACHVLQSSPVASRVYGHVTVSLSVFRSERNGEIHKLRFEYL